jgi:hypothetical protein
MFNENLHSPASTGAARNVRFPDERRSILTIRTKYRRDKLLIRKVNTRQSLQIRAGFNYIHLAENNGHPHPAKRMRQVAKWGLAT